jgi:hypothetical protein
MAARLNEDTTKIHLHIYSEDLEYIDANFCRPGIRTVGRSKALRLIIHSYVQHLKRKANAHPVQFDPSISELLDG